MRVVLAFAVNTLFNFIIGLMVAKFLGPEEYGRFALALAVAIVIQTALFDWVKLAATRLYSERARRENPALRATLDLCVVALIGLLCAGALTIFISGFEFKLSSVLLSLALVAAVANGLFDYHAALVRARFLDQDYARLVIVKNLFAFALTGGAAFFFGSAQMALTGACLAIASSVAFVLGPLRDHGSPVRAASPGAARAALGYALPIVAANVLYQLAPLLNRAIIADQYGFAETGQFSLAYDIDVRIVAAIGSTLDVLLFQIAVRADESHGVAEGKAQLARNMALVFAIVLPACAGLWLVLPSVEAILVPEQFRGPFAHYLGLMVPGLFAFAMINYAVNPIFQLAKRTAPLIAAAVLAVAADLVAVLLMPRAADATGIALAQAGMFIVALAALLVFAAFTRPQWPRARDLAGAALGALAMAAALFPMRAWGEGPLALLAQVVVGGAIYGAIVIALNVAGLREVLDARLAALRGRVRAQL